MSAGWDLCVVGGGSGGFGAACAAARLGARVLLLEAADGLGGTSTRAGVNNYEPVAGATGLPQEVYERLRQIPDAVALQEPWVSYTPEKPWGWMVPAKQTDYRLSLSRRSGVAIAFEPAVLDRVMRQMLHEAGVEVRLQTRFTGAERAGRRIQAIGVEGPSGAGRVEAAVFIDATADIYLARAVGCRTAIGSDTATEYGEADAGPTRELALNNASLCYRVARLQAGEAPTVEAAPPGFDLESIRPVTSIRTYPNGDLNMNPLHIMSGVEAYQLGTAARDEALQRVQAHWHILQARYGFDGWKRVWTSPALGVRETHRLVARYVLRQQDLDAGLAGQEHEDLVALADHAVDFHGARPSRELEAGPYGVPFRCLLPQEIDNMLVACRGAGFSSIAASSCRLSRTMMVLGQAAGTAAALFGRAVAEFDAPRLREQLRRDGVALELDTGYLDALSDIEPMRPPRW